MAAKKQARTARPPLSVYVIDAWDDDESESYVAVFSSRAKARRELERWQAKRSSHDTYVGIVKRRVL